MEDYLKILIALGLFIILVGIFIGTYILNKRTPKPEGCKSLDEDCKICGVTSCSHHPQNKGGK